MEIVALTLYRSCKQGSIYSTSTEELHSLTKETSTYYFLRIPEVIREKRFFEEILKQLIPSILIKNGKIEGLSILHPTKYRPIRYPPGPGYIKYFNPDAYHAVIMFSDKLQKKLLVTDSDQFISPLEEENPLSQVIKRKSEEDFIKSLDLGTDFETYLSDRDDTSFCIMM